MCVRVYVEVQTQTSIPCMLSPSVFLSYKAIQIVLLLDAALPSHPSPSLSSKNKATQTNSSN